jgi:hypothetical protein
MSTPDLRSGKPPSINFRAKQAIREYFKRGGPAITRLELVELLLNQLGLEPDEEIYVSGAVVDLINSKEIRSTPDRAYHFMAGPDLKDPSAV